MEFTRYGKSYQLPLYHEEAVDRLVRACAKHGWACRVTDMGRNLLEGGADAVQAV